MKKWIATAALVAMTALPIHADVMLVQTMTLEGAAAALMGNMKLPRMTMRIKGERSRVDIEMLDQTITAITDLSSRQVIVLNASAKTAMITEPGAEIPGGVTLPKIDVSFKPTGKTQLLEGQHCEEHTIKIQLNMAEAGGGNFPPEAAAAMKDVQMILNGSIWISPSAPGASEYAAYNKAALNSNLLAAIAGLAGSKGAGFDKLMEAVASASGLPYLTDISLQFEGTGPFIDAMKQMGPIRMIQKTVSVSTETIPATMFQVPEGYRTEKK